MEGEDNGTRLPRRWFTLALKISGLLRFGKTDLSYTILDLIFAFYQARFSSNVSPFCIKKKAKIIVELALFVVYNSLCIVEYWYLWHVAS